VFAVDLDLASKRASVQTLQIATWVQAERRRRAVGRAAWMPRERCQDMDVRSARAHGASPSLRYSDEGGTQPGARTLGYLVSFQVTRRRRNRSGVSQSPICRAAITWRIQISSCTRPPMGAVRQPGPRLDNRGRSVDNFITDPPPRCRRTAPASPTGNASRQTAVFAVDLDLASMCAPVRTTQIATWVQAERRRRAVGRAAWMPRERCQDMDVRSARAHGASPE
jgi:hypothetical protein